MPIPQPRRLLAGLLLLGAVVLVLAAPAAAHVTLVFSSPADGALLAEAPASLRLQFDDRISEAGADVTIVSGDGEIATTLAIEGDGLVATPESPIGAGTHVVTWRVVSYDGHPRGGRITFSVGFLSEVPDVRASAAGVSSDLAIATGLATVGLLVSAGALAAGAFVLPSTRRARRLASYAAAGAVGFGLLAVPLAGAYRLGLDWLSLDQGRVWALDLVGGELIAWVVTALTLPLACALAVRAPRAATALAAVAVTTPAWTGHTRATTSPALATFADATHLLAGAVWLGGLAAIALSWSGVGEADRHRVLRRFGRIAGAALLVLTAEGALLGWLVLGSVDALVSTAYGRLLLVKVSLVAAIAAWAGWRNRRRPTTRTLGLEVAALAVVPMLAGFLVNLAPEPASAPPARPPLAAGETDGVRIVAGPTGRLLLEAATPVEAELEVEADGRAVTLRRQSSSTYVAKAEPGASLTIAGEPVTMTAVGDDDAPAVTPLSPVPTGAGGGRVRLAEHDDLTSVEVAPGRGTPMTAYVVRTDLAFAREVPLTRDGGAWAGTTALTPGTYVVAVVVRTDDGERLLTSRARLPGSWEPKAAGAPTTQARDGFSTITLGAPLAQGPTRTPYVVSAADGRALPTGAVAVRGALVVDLDGTVALLGEDGGELVGEIGGIGDARLFVLRDVVAIPLPLAMDVTLGP